MLLPTAYGFAAGHCVRVAIAGADSKHFTVDHQGDRTIWVHTGGSHACTCDFAWFVQALSRQGASHYWS